MAIPPGVFCCCDFDCYRNLPRPETLAVTVTGLSVMPAAQYSDDEGLLSEYRGLGTPSIIGNTYTLVRRNQSCEWYVDIPVGSFPFEFRYRQYIRSPFSDNVIGAEMGEWKTDQTPFQTIRITIRSGVVNKRNFEYRASVSFTGGAYYTGYTGDPPAQFVSVSCSSATIQYTPPFPNVFNIGLPRDSEITGLGWWRNIPDYNYLWGGPSWFGVWFGGVMSAALKVVPGAPA